MLDEEIIRLYDEEIAKHPEGAKSAEGKAAIREIVRELIAETPRDLDRETDVAINRAIDCERDRRSKGISRDLEYILDYFASPEDAALIPDSRMEWAIRLGTSDGADKTLKFWRAEDFIFWAQVRIQQAGDAMAAAQIAQDIADRVVARMTQCGARNFGDVNWVGGSAGAA